MSILAIELNDAGIIVAGEEGLLGPPSPGYAVLDGADLRIGVPAFESARLLPRRTNHVFWDRLDRAPLARPFPRGMSHADLAHAHLQQLWAERIESAPVGAGLPAVVVAVPGCLSEAQLGLLVGIARACEIPVTGLVDAAVAAVSVSAPNGRLLHLDLGLHRVVWSELERGEMLLRRRVRVADGCGLVGIRDCWARSIADTFIRRTRFDPLHRAETEQVLYRSVPAWAARAALDGRTVISMTASDGERSVELEAGQLAAAAKPCLDTIVESGQTLLGAGEPVTVLLSVRAAGLPGLALRLARIADVEVRSLPAEAATAGALRHRSQIESPGSELMFVSSLRPGEAGERGGEEAIPRIRAPLSESAGRRPTHLLYGETAHAITDVPFWLGTALPPGVRGLTLTGSVAGVSRTHCCVVRRNDRVLVEDHSTYGTFVNGRRIDGRAELVTGSRLRLGSPGLELRLIRVIATDG